MDPRFFRNYANLIEAAEQDMPAPQQLDEGVMDMLKPYIQKTANAVMSKLDPQTLAGLKQAYNASGGRPEKFMANIGITKQDLAGLARGKRAAAPVAEAWATSSLKGKVLTVLMNVLPSIGILDLLSGGNLGGMMGDVTAYIFYIVSAALMWGIGHYDFTDNANAKPGAAPAPGPGSRGAGMGTGSF